MKDKIYGKNKAGWLKSNKTKSMKVIIHKENQFKAHRVTAKFDSWESFSLILQFAKDGIAAYLAMKEKNGDTDAGMYKDCKKMVNGINEVLAAETDGVEYAKKDLRGIIDVDL